MSDMPTGEEGAEDLQQRYVMPNNATAFVTPPSQVDHGEYRSTHGGGFMNNGAHTVKVVFMASLSDSLGRLHRLPNVEVTVPPGGSHVFDPVNASFAVSDYQPGTTVTFEAMTVVTDGTQSSGTMNATQRNTLTIPTPGGP